MLRFLFSLSIRADRMQIIPNTRLSVFPGVADQVADSGYDHAVDGGDALAAEGLAREQVKAHAGLRADVAEQAGVQAEDEAADDERDEEAAEIQTVGQLLTDPHARREKGEAEHDHEHGHDAAARVLRHRRLRKVDIYRRLFFFH